MNNKHIIILFLAFFTFLSLNAQPITNKVHMHKIKTVQCHKEGWPFTYPIINLNGEGHIELSFDDLHDETRDLYYTLIHCNENWEISQLAEMDYMNGIIENPILDYTYSFNSNIDYVHYKVTLPNDDVEILVSGNYIIKVFEDNDSENVVLTQRFMVTEQMVTIIPEVRYTMNSEIRKAKQEIDFVVQHQNFAIQNALEEVKVNIFQNGRKDNAITQLKPQFIKNNELVYNYNRETLFEGGNEFRWLDLRSLRFQSSKVQKIMFHDPYNHIDLFPDKIFAGQSYFFNNDFNGRYIIEVQERDDPAIEADYVFVHFSLPRSEPLVGGDVHIMGSLTNWQFKPSSKMQYNFNLKQYECTLLLKQGFYNYQYAFKPNNLSKASVSMFEGSHSKTENDYLILVYYKGMGDYSDRLIGVAQVNSVDQ